MRVLMISADSRKSVWNKDILIIVDFRESTGFLTFPPLDAIPPI
jgi:hypothetical protein